MMQVTEHARRPVFFKPEYKNKLNEIRKELEREFSHYRETLLSIFALAGWWDKYVQGSVIPWAYITKENGSEMPLDLLLLHASTTTPVEYKNGYIDRGRNDLIDQLTAISNATDFRQYNADTSTLHNNCPLLLVNYLDADRCATSIGSVEAFKLMPIWSISICPQGGEKYVAIQYVRGDENCSLHNIQSNGRTVLDYIKGEPVKLPLSQVEIIAAELKFINDTMSLVHRVELCYELLDKVSWRQHDHELTQGVELSKAVRSQIVLEETEKYAKYRILAREAINACISESILTEDENAYTWVYNHDQYESIYDFALDIIPRVRVDKIRYPSRYSDSNDRNVQDHLFPGFDEWDCQSTTSV